MVRTATSLALLIIAVFTPTTYAAPYELVDLATPYAAFWDEMRHLPTTERVTAFKARFDTMLPGFFKAQRAGWTDEEYDSAITRSFEKFPAIRERFTATTVGFSKLLEPAYADFARSFPDIRPIGPIYIVHSLGEFDGGTRRVAGQSRLLFGADVIAQLHDFPDERPFFHHELFHVYHGQFFAECEQVWCALWLEGLATYAAQRLNPRASDAQLLLTFPSPIRPAVERDRRAAVCAVTSRLESADSTDYSALFSAGSVSGDLPPRFGYYLGYLVAEEAARKMSLVELAHQNNAEAHETVKAALAKLADCRISR